MRRFFFVALAAGLLSPTTAMAEPVPGISDLDSTFKEPIRIDFACPKIVTREIQDGRLQTVRKKQYSSCWVDFHKGYLNVMDRQKIKRSEKKRQ